MVITILRSSLFRILNKLHFNFRLDSSTTVVNGVICENDFDLLISSDIDLGSRSLKI